MKRRLASEIGKTREVLIESATQGRTEHFLPVAIENGVAGDVQAMIISGHDGMRLVAKAC
ncbi:hypothetical protein CRBSH125_19410 [Afipia carboxidovorans]|nr:hypothetical protein CRBSH125_19410 [Afipia carboxidovorans]